MHLFIILQASLDRIAPEGTFYTHSDEGPDDMPAHVKSSLMGAGLCVPVAKGKLALGTCEWRHSDESIVDVFLRVYTAQQVYTIPLCFKLCG